MSLRPARCYYRPACCCCCCCCCCYTPARCFYRPARCCCCCCCCCCYYRPACCCCCCCCCYTPPVVITDQPRGVRILLPHVPAVLDYVHGVVDTLLRQKGRSKTLPHRVLTTLARYQQLVGQGYPDSYHGQ